MIDDKIILNFCKTTYLEYFNLSLKNFLFITINGVIYYCSLPSL